MKKFILLLCMVSSLTLAADSDVQGSPELQTLFYKNFMHEDNEIFFFVMAESVVQETNSKIDAVDLVNHFKKAAQDPDFAKKYMDVFAESFDATELKGAANLVENEDYLKYRQPISFVNMACMSIMTDYFIELVQNKGIKEQTKKLATGEVLSLTSDTLSYALESYEYVILVVYSDSSGPCKYLVPVYTDLNKTFGKQYQFAKLDGEQYRSVSNSYGIQTFPTIIFFKNGVEMGRESGFMNKDKFTLKIKQFFK